MLQKKKNNKSKTRSGDTKRIAQLNAKVQNVGQRKHNEENLRKFTCEYFFKCKDVIAISIKKYSHVNLRRYTPFLFFQWVISFSLSLPISFFAPLHLCAFVLSCVGSLSFYIGSVLASSPVTRLSLFLLFCIVLSGCTADNSTPPTFTWQQFYCRDQGISTERLALYRAKVPSHWIRSDPLPKDSIADSTLPNCEFHIGFPPTVHLTLHTFPIDTFEQRIPPEAQISRWKRQFDEIDPSALIIEPRSLGGFTGLSLYAEGSLKDEECSVLGYSMQLAPVHWRALQTTQNEPPFKQKQMSSDYTLKATGTPESIAKYKSEIELFANSFELIEEIPIR